MAKTKIKQYHSAFKRAPALRIVSVIVFAMLVNILNLTAFFSMENSFRPNNAVMQLENKLGRIYNAVNMPIKIVNNLFQENKLAPVNKKNKNDSVKEYFAFFVPAKQANKTGNMLLDAIAPPNVQKGNKIIYYKLGDSYFSDISLKHTGITDRLASGGIVMCLLLLMMLMLALPRGIPVKIKKIINIIFAFPVFILNKGGIFHFNMECRGRAK